MVNNSKVSVVIPLYNGRKVICRALDSVLSQTCSVDEVIIVNDGSTDDSVNVINEYIKIKNDIPHVNIINKENGGVSTARNIGIKLSKNEYVAFLDCDDEWVNNKIELQLKEIKKENVVLVGGNHFDTKIKRISLRKLSQDINEVYLFDLLFKNYFQTSTVMVKKSIALKFGAFDESQTHAEEGQFYYNMSSSGKLIHINRHLVIYDGGNKSGFGESGLSGDIFSMEKGELKNLYFAYNKLDVNIFIYFISISCSILKFFRRAVIKEYKNWSERDA